MFEVDTKLDTLSWLLWRHKQFDIELREIIRVRKSSSWLNS